jgi:hypothetical protein
MDFRITITGTSGLIMNNARTSNPLDPAAKALKALTGKRNKTDADHLEIFRVGHLGALYHDADVGPYLPSDNIWKALLEGAMKHRMGPKIKEGVVITTEVNPLAYRGARDVNGIWADENFRFYASRVTGSGARRVRVPFCRPIFREWKASADGTLDDGIIDLAELRLIAETAGQRIGIGDWRPRFGRFTAKVENA